MGYSLMSINKDGQTALHVASQRGDSNLVRYILANAPSNIVSIKDNQEWVNQIYIYYLVLGKIRLLKTLTSTYIILLYYYIYN